MSNRIAVDESNQSRRWMNWTGGNERSHRGSETRLENDPGREPALLGDQSRSASVTCKGSSKQEKRLGSRPGRLTLGPRIVAASCIRQYDDTEQVTVQILLTVVHRSRLQPVDLLLLSE